MKKVLAIALSVIMMFAVCVPAFAAESKTIIINDKAPEIVDGKQTADSKLSTSTKKEDGTDGASYVVTIPAETIIPWEKAKTLFSYSVYSQLESGKRLAISAASQSGRNVLVDAAGANELPYSFSKTNGGEAIETLNYTTETEVVNTNRTFNIDIADSAWKAVPVNEYVGYLTFTVEVVDA